MRQKGEAAGARPRSCAGEETRCERASADRWGQAALDCWNSISWGRSLGVSILLTEPSFEGRRSEAAETTSAIAFPRNSQISEGGSLSSELPV